MNQLCREGSAIGDIMVDTVQRLRSGGGYFGPIQPIHLIFLSSSADIGVTRPDERDFGAVTSRPKKCRCDRMWAKGAGRTARDSSAAAYQSGRAAKRGATSSSYGPRVSAYFKSVLKAASPKSAKTRFREIDEALSLLN